MEGQDVKADKHFTLWEAMCGHRVVLNRLSELVDRVQGIGQSEQKEEQKGEPKTTPPLSEFLDKGVEEVKVMTDILATQTSKLESLLF